MSELSQRLNRIRAHMNSTSELSRAPQSCQPKALPGRYAKLRDTLNGELVQSATGVYVRITTLYPFDTSWGSAKLEKLAGDTCIPRSSFTIHDEPGEHTLRSLLFFDTETTGLGGSGTVAFLFGLGRIVEAGFEVTQYLLPDYDDEHAVLEQILADFSSQNVLVTYNGTTFDLPLVKDRMVINRVARTLPVTGHVDLLHPVRRLFSRRLQDCSLASVERQIFSYFRQDDVAGYLIPSLYFEWLHSEEPAGLSGILEHNRQDIVTLYALLNRITAIFKSEGKILDFKEDMYSLSRVYGRRKHLSAASDLLDRVPIESSERDGDIVWFHSLLLRRQKEWHRAAELWLRLVAMDCPQAIYAHVELAKFYEHKTKDHFLALKHVQSAFNLSQGRLTFRTQLEVRLRRLHHKVSANKPPAQS